MNGIHEPRSEQDQHDEREELAGLLPAAAVTGLSRRRHLLLTEHLRSAITEDSRRADRRRSLTLRLAMPVAVAAATVGVVLVIGSGAGRPAAAPPATSKAPGGTSLGDVADAGYTVQTDGEGVVRVTVMKQYERVDYVRLQHDLDRLAIPARVYAGEADCRAAAPVTPTYPADFGPGSDTDQARLTRYGWDVESGPSGEVLLFQSHHRLPVGEQLFLYLPYAKTDPANGFRSLEDGVMRSPAPACMPGQTYTVPPALAAQMTSTGAPTPASR
jgi:hypothetical protein